LLNPILRQKLIENASDEDRNRLEILGKQTKFETMETFNVTTDRHLNLYGYRTENFPQSYHPLESPLNYANDPDWSVKYEYTRIKLKRVFIAILICFWFVQWKVKKVE
jgi:hypothetical protein